MLKYVYPFVYRVIRLLFFSYNHFREMEVFPKFHSVPFSKILTLFRKSPFVLIAGCGDPDADYNQKSDTISRFQI